MGLFKNIPGLSALKVDDDAAANGAERFRNTRRCRTESSRSRTRSSRCPTRPSTCSGSHQETRKGQQSRSRSSASSKPSPRRAGADLRACPLFLGQVAMVNPDDTDPAGWRGMRAMASIVSLACSGKAFPGRGRTADTQGFALMFRWRAESTALAEAILAAPGRACEPLRGIELHAEARLGDAGAGRCRQGDRASSPAESRARS